MAETELHAEAMWVAYATLKSVFAERSDVARGIDMLHYYEKGNPAARFAPDVWVAIGAPKRVRRTYKYWEEPVPPTFVLEVSSRGTWLEDHGNKKALCASLGILEYFLFDPEGEYLDPVLQGFRLVDGQYERIASSDGLIESHALGLRLRSEGAHIRFYDSSGAALAHYTEIGERAEARAKGAEARASAAEVEVERLKRELAAAKK